MRVKRNLGSRLFLYKGGSLPYAPAPSPPIVKPALSGLLHFIPTLAGLSLPLLAGFRRQPATPGLQITIFFSIIRKSLKIFYNYSYDTRRTERT